MQPSAPNARRRAPYGLLTLILTMAAGLALPSAADAQDLRYKQVTTTEFAGFMGSAMSVSGEDLGPDTTVNWMKGLKQRVDQADGRATEILDLGTMEMASWHHVDSTYYVLNFQQYMQSADSSMAEAREAMTDEDRAQMNAFEPTLEVDRTGETRTINGWEAERVIMTLTLEPSTEGMSQEEMEEAMEQDAMGAMMGQSGMVTLSELWISDDLPGFQEMREALADESADFATGSGGMESLAAGYPQMAALAEEMQKEMQSLDGVTVRSTVYTLMAPGNAPLNRDSILEMSDEPLPQGPDLSELMTQAMASAGEDAAMDAVSSALGGLGGLFGRGGDDKKEEPEEMQLTGAGGPTVIMRIVTEIIEAESLPLSDADFLPPPWYRERERPVRN